MFRLRLDSSEQCKVWHHRIFGAMKPSANFRDTFAFIHYAYSRDIPSQLNVRHGKRERETEEERRYNCQQLIVVDMLFVIC